MKDGGKKAAATRINREVDRMFEAIDAPTSPKSYRNMSMTSSLEDVVAKGSPYYNGVRSFKRWSLIMTNKYGVAVAPYLEEAWNLIEENTKLVQVHTQEPKVQAASARVIN
jgi:hypothetical protein